MYNVLYIFHTNCVYFQCNKNEKQLLRRIEAGKRSDTILKEILKTNKRTKIDDNEVLSQLYRYTKIIY